MSTMNVSLPDELKSFVDARVDMGGYGSTSEYVRDLIRRDQDRERLRGLLVEGASTPLGPVADESFFEALRDRVRSVGGTRRAQTRQAARAGHCRRDRGDLTHRGVAADSDHFTTPERRAVMISSASLMIRSINSFTVGMSLIRPCTIPADQMPPSGSPSFIAC